MELFYFYLGWNQARWNLFDEFETFMDKWNIWNIKFSILLVSNFQLKLPNNQNFIETPKLKKWWQVEVEFSMWYETIRSPTCDHSVSAAPVVSYD